MRSGARYFTGARDSSAMAAAAMTAAATTTVSAATMEAAAATVIELRMMAEVVMSFPRMVDDEARIIAPAISPTP